MKRRTLTLHAPFMLVLEQALNSAAEAEAARTARTAVSFIVLALRLLEERGSIGWRSWAVWMEVWRICGGKHVGFYRAPV